MEIVKEIEVKDAIEKGFALIDVRTKKEFDEFHIPGAVNVPLFSEEEKEKISKVYYERGEKEARIFALELVSPRLSEIVRKIKEIKDREKKVAVYCWRGGMRSLAVASICNLCGVYVFRLKGGYRAFRRYVLEEIEKLVSDKEFIVIYGPTGVGKTRILRKLKEEGFPVLDLEGLAGHRGSVFGGIGLKQPSQKMFDSLLWLELKRLESQPFVVVEGESRKIGNIHLPEPVWRKLIEGRRILVELPLEERVRISMEDYGVGDFSISVYLDALKRIKKILGDKKYSEIKELIEDGKFEEAVRELMVNYYDKLYAKSTPPPHTTIKAENFNEAYKRIKDVLREYI